MTIDTTFLRRCIASLETAVDELERHGDRADALYGIYRTTCFRKFELVLEHGGKLLRKRLAAWFATNRQADRLHFKDLFRHAARHDLMTPDCVESWLRYRDSGDAVVHDDAGALAEATLRRLPAFIADARSLAEMIERENGGRRFHLARPHRRILEALLRKYLPDVEVWAYGSRVNGRSHDGSDLDLVLRGPGLGKIPVDRLVDFEEAVRESMIPILVEARDWARLPEAFHREIEREYVVLVEASATRTRMTRADRRQRQADPSGDEGADSDEEAV